MYYTPHPTFEETEIRDETATQGQAAWKRQSRHWTQVSLCPSSVADAEQTVFPGQVV